MELQNMTQQAAGMDGTEDQGLGATELQDLELAMVGGGMGDVLQ